MAPRVASTDGVTPLADRAADDDHNRLHAAASPSRLAQVSPAVAEQLQRARRVEAFVIAGRHAAAERLARDVAGALGRRQAHEPCARMRIELGRLMLIRGRPADAQLAFSDARRAADAAHAARLGLDAALWEIAALTDAARLDDAYAAARAIQSSHVDAAHLAWGDACLLRLLLCRGDLVGIVECVPSSEPQEDPVVAAWIDSMAVRGLLAGGRMFEAGLRLAAARERASMQSSALARSMVERARLRVAAAAGDVEMATTCLAEVRRVAREARAPLEVPRATLDWVRLLRRAGLTVRAETAWRALCRAARAAPPLLRLAIEREAVGPACSERGRTGPRRASPPVPSSPALVPEIIGPSAALEELRRTIVRAGAAPFAVLIEGESGSGKELVARAIHRLSPRAHRRFCDLNCAALPDELVEAELFGHTRGAFTGAVGERAGLFEDASGGTLFLDEVSELSLRAQAKLLRVIQQQEVRRLGETHTRSVDVRIVAAANRCMQDEAAAGRFRPDLLYRLDVVRVRVPALRERPEDVPVLAEAFWALAAARVGSTAILSEGVLRSLASYAWPGNVRELQNVMAALAVGASPRGLIPSSQLPPRIREPHVRHPTLTDVRSACERDAVRNALARAHGSRAVAARELGLTRQGLLKTMRRLGVDARPEGG